MLAALDNEGYQYIVGARMRRLKGAQRALAEPGPYQKVNDRLEVRESAGRDRWQVERAFRDLKINLDLRPIYHWIPRRIHGHIMLCFLAFALERLLVRRLKESQPKLEYPQVRPDVVGRFSHPLERPVK